MPQSTLGQTVTRDHSLGVPVPAQGSVVVTNVAGATVFYADYPQVSPATNQGSIAQGASQAFTAQTWLCSQGNSQVSVVTSTGRKGTSAAMTSGSVVVPFAGVTAASQVFVTRAPGGTNPGAVWVSAITPGVSFTVTSTSGTDTGTVFYEIFEP